MKDPCARYIGKQNSLRLPMDVSKINGLGKQQMLATILLKAFRQLDPAHMMPLYSTEARYMPKIVAQLKMHLEIAEKVRAEETVVGNLYELLAEEGTSARAEYR